MVYVAAIRTELDDLWLKFNILFNVLLMSSLSLKLSKAANVFEILICYQFLTPSSFNFLRLNLSTSKFHAAYLRTANLSFTSVTT
jgi:hypothetical protein